MNTDRLRTDCADTISVEIASGTLNNDMQLWQSVQRVVLRTYHDAGKSYSPIQWRHIWCQLETHCHPCRSVSSGNWTWYLFWVEATQCRTGVCSLSSIHVRQRGVPGVVFAAIDYFRCHCALLPPPTNPSCGACSRCSYICVTFTCNRFGFTSGIQIGPNVYLHAR